MGAGEETPARAGIPIALLRGLHCVAPMWLGLLVGAPADVVGQWRRDDIWQASRRQVPTKPVIPPTHWVEGAVIGAAIVGTTAAIGAYELGCEFADDRSWCNPGTVLLGGALGGVLGGIVGGLVGGRFPAKHPRPLKGYPQRTALIGAMAGALWSFGLVFQGCSNGCHSEEVVLGVSTTGAGALAGFLIGR